MTAIAIKGRMNLTLKSWTRFVYQHAPNQLGTLFRKHESGTSGSLAIGSDSAGGASYGAFQISTKKGTMNSFMRYIKSRDPATYQRLHKVYSSRFSTSGAFAVEWKKLAREGRLYPLEHAFIKRSHFDAAYKKLGSREQGVINSSPTLQEVLWSVAVQHGPGGAGSIFRSSYDPNPQRYIQNIYAARARRLGHLTPGEQASVKRRYKNEEKEALNHLMHGGVSNNMPYMPGSAGQLQQMWAAYGQSPHFKINDFRCRDGSMAPIDPRLILGLEQLRSLLGNRPIRIISGYRSPKYNTSIGGAKASYHMKGMAADIQVDGVTPSQVKAGAEKIPLFNGGGIGLYSSFTHVDVRGKRARW